MPTTREMKYIVVEQMPGMKIAILFPDTIAHSDIDVSRVGTIISAGTCKIYAGDNPEQPLYVDCYGESISLKVKSRDKADAEVVLHALQRPW